MQTRDLEILRTLGRLYFVTSAEINGTFFNSEKAGWRRLKMLADRNYIKRHTAGYCSASVGT